MDSRLAHAGLDSTDRFDSAGLELSRLFNSRICREPLADPNPIELWSGFGACGGDRILGERCIQEMGSRFDPHGAWCAGGWIWCIFRGQEMRFSRMGLGEAARGDGAGAGDCAEAEGWNARGPYRRSAGRRSVSQRERMVQHGASACLSGNEGIRALLLRRHGADWQRSIATRLSKGRKNFAGGRATAN